MGNQVIQLGVGVGSRRARLISGSMGKSSWVASELVRGTAEAQAKGKAVWVKVEACYLNTSSFVSGFFIGSD